MTSMTNDETVVVLGATGYVGRLLVERLLAVGYRVRAVARDRARAAAVLPPGCEIVCGDVLDAASLPEALAGATTAFYLVHAMGGDEFDFEERDRRGAHHFARAAAASDIRRIIYLGGLGRAGRHLSRHLRSRQEVGAILRSSGVPTTELRAGVIVGAGSASFEMVRELVERLPWMLCPRWVSTRCQPIAIDDILAYLVGCLREPATAGRILEVGGPAVLSYEQMILRLARQAGLRRRLVRVPVLTPRLSSYWVDVVTSVPAGLARPLIEGLESDLVVRDDTARRLLPMELTPSEEAVRRALAERRPAPPEAPLAWLGRVPRRLGGVLRDAFWPPVLRDAGVEETHAPPETVYRTLASLGGANGWPAYDWAWRARGAVDRLLGGPGLDRRATRRPEGPRPGDRIDFWTVVEADRPRRLRLEARMKVPGRAELEFEVAPLPGSRGSVLFQTARFRPASCLGRAYWYALLPLHALIFRATARAIAARSDAMPRGTRDDRDGVREGGQLPASSVRFARRGRRRRPRPHPRGLAARSAGRDRDGGRRSEARNPRSRRPRDDPSHRARSRCPVSRARGLLTEGQERESAGPAARAGPSSSPRAGRPEEQVDEKQMKAPPRPCGPCTGSRASLRSRPRRSRRG
jgi:uncharacterized protein YbjT (DUF2867 family)